MIRPIRMMAKAGIVGLARSLGAVLPNDALALLKENMNLVERMDYDPETILLQIESRLEHQVRLRSCAKEPETIQWIQQSLREGDVFYDIGANVGAYSLVAAMVKPERVTIYAFEPAFRNFSQLCQNIYLNGCGGSIVPLPLALSDKTILDIFNYSNLTPGGALHALGKPRDFKGDDFTPVFHQQVLSYRLDDFISQFSIKPPNLMKIDVDGIEGSILRGAAETLRNRSLRAILAEVEEDGAETPELLEFLRANGFELEARHQTLPQWSLNYPKSYNYLFVRHN